jgi:hypothetical protein
MAEEKKTAPKTTMASGKPDDQPAAKPAAPSSRSRRPAAESSEPAVHQLLAEQDIARQNGDEDEVKRTQDALADLGYE